MPMNDNAILDFSALPRFDEIRPAHASSAVDSALSALAAAADHAAEAQPTWDAMWEPLSGAEESVDRVWSQIEHMHAVMSNDGWRDAHRSNLEKITAGFARLGQHEGVYANLQALASRAGDLSPGRRVILKKALRDFELAGVNLPAEKKKEFRANSERLAALGSRFSENVMDATAAGGVDVADEAALGDMPPDLRQAARAEEGGFRFSLLPPSYAAFMRYSPARALREEMYRAYSTRASEHGPAERDNAPLIGEILNLRNRQAKLLGFGDYAELALQTRMAESPAHVTGFLRELAAKARPAAEKEIAELREFADRELGIADLQAWDVLYAAEQLRRRRFNFSAAELRPYLRVSRVLRGLFSCIEKLFGVSLAPADAPKWAPQTEYFEVRGADGKAVGGLYLDLYARPEKRGGAWMADSLSRCRRRGDLQLPVAIVACNFTRPEGPADEALMDWDEALVLFHEFGHALHHVLTEVDDYAASGMNGVEWDAVELPSQFMENFLWDWGTLSPMTSHAETGEPIPRDLFDRAVAARRFHAGLHLVRQLEFALFDMGLHTGEPRPFMDVLKDTRRETAVMEPPAWSRFPCSFDHIFAGGYAAGYYSYLWAESLSADAFAMFEKSSETVNPTLGARFRQEILAMGGSRPSMESFTALLGRAPDPAALLRHYGIA